MYTRLCVEYPLFLSYFNQTCIISEDLKKNTQISTFMKIRAVGAELLHADRRTDRYEEANGRFLEFCQNTWKGSVLLRSQGNSGYANAPHCNVRTIFYLVEIITDGWTRSILEPHFLYHRFCPEI
jgi:hypothetical protein